MLKKYIFTIIALVMTLLSVLTGCNNDSKTTCSELNSNISTSPAEQNNSEHKTTIFTNIPDYSDEPYVEINSNKPFFTDKELTTSSYEYYSELDELGRCGVCYACIGKDLMPTEDRGPIGMVKPTGWQIAKYDFVDGGYLYNRCHLIGYQLTGENANTKNLITGTRYLNIEGMLPFENKIADYVSSTDNHVMYRVTPIFEGDNLLADGVEMEGYSVEDKGKGIYFNVYCYNVQPNVEIDYSNGNSKKSNTITSNSITDSTTATYILNLNTKKFHLENCSLVNSINPKNKKEYIGSKDELISDGYEPCKVCKP